MSNETLTTFSNALADIVANAASSVVQVQGGRTPASGLVYDDAIVLTTVRNIDGEEGLRVRGTDGATFDAELAGWDPTTTLAVLRAPGLSAPALAPSITEPRVGHLVVAVARSWSSNLTASSGMIAVIGGPLRTGRNRAIDQVVRITAPMHSGFGGGALLDTGGGLVGVATATVIRGTGVAIPASIAWKTAAAILEHGGLRRGYLGIAGQPVRLSSRQRGGDRETGLLVVNVTPGAPADAGVLVGDVILELDGQPVESPEDLFDLLVGDRVGKRVTLKVHRGGTVVDAPVTIGERPKSE